MPNEVGVILFRLVVPGILFGLQFFLYRKVDRWMRSRRRFERPGRIVIRSLFVFFNAAALYAFIARPSVASFPDLLRYGIVFPFFLWHGATFFLTLLLLASLLLKSPFRMSWWAFGKLWPSKAEAVRSNPSFERFNASRRTFLTRGMYGLSALSFGGTAYGLAYEKGSCDINTAEFRIPDLPPGLDGFSIALLSDIHSGVFMDREQMERYVQEANKLGADAIIVAGDFVNSNVREVYPFGEAFSALHAPSGVYGVMGNHDYYTGYPEIVAREIEECGIVLLRDAETLVQRGKDRFSLAGIDDVRTMDQAREGLSRAYGSEERSLARVLICHRPYFLQAASEKNVDLVLSGHTHGGQIVLGRFGETTIAPASLASRYVWGSYRRNGSSMYISRGIGTVGIPIRINCPPEITRIVLRSGPLGPRSSDS